jgi:iron complex outermembrane receptor protein
MTGFVEATASLPAFGGMTLFGSALQLDDFENSVNQEYDHRWVTPSVFATTDRSLGPVTLSLSLRGDAHPEAGVQATERVSALVKPFEGWSFRASTGTGFAAPSPVNEETEAIGLRAIQPGPKLERERSRASMLDINGEVAGAELLVTVYASVISNAIQLVHTSAQGTDVTLRNASQSTRVGGVEGAAIWRFDGGKFLGTYGYTRGSRPDEMTGSREPIPMLPRHRFGADLMFEREGQYRWGLEGIWYGEQTLDDNPYRARSKPYLYTMAIYMRQFGRIEAVANFENLLNVRQTDTHSLVRPTPGMGGRWTTDVWAPLEGFMANVALRYRW